MQKGIFNRVMIFAILILIFVFSVFVPNIGTMNININSIKSFKNQSDSVKQFNIFKGPLADVWDVELEFNEPGGAYDNQFFGEKIDASDGLDGYDVPKTGGGGFPPYIRAFFATDFPEPHNLLWEEYKHYPDNYKDWNLSVQWVPSDYSSPTTLTISWNNASFDNSEYNSVTLYDVGNDVNLSDMLANTSYTFTCPALTLQNFKIICVLSAYDISLYNGWNLITIPTSIDYLASTLAENITGCELISWYDCENQTYKTFIVGGPPQFDFPILDGYGYFVLVNQSSNLSLSGSRINDVSVPLCDGWNMIGWYNQSVTMASYLAENISNCSLVSWFNASSQSFETYIVGGPPQFDFLITQGIGVFVLIDSDKYYIAQNVLPGQP